MDEYEYGLQLGAFKRHGFFWFSNSCEFMMAVLVLLGNFILEFWEETEKIQSASARASLRYGS